VSWLLSLIPAPYRLLAELGLVAALAVAAWAWVARAEHQAEAKGYARGRAEFTHLQAEMTAKALAGERAARTEEARRNQAQKEVDDEAQRIAQLDRTRRAAVDMRVAAADDRLQRDIAAVAARGSGVAGDPAAAGERKAATEALADILGACRRALRQLGRDADEEVADLFERAGRCAARYDALNVSR
jgi:hypothetical protein